MGIHEVALICTTFDTQKGDSGEAIAEVVQVILGAKKIGKLAYKLDLPTEALIHATVHVSQLKLSYGVTSQANPLTKEYTRTSARVS